MKNDSMFQIEKQKKILQYINNKKKATVNELSDFLGVSKVTIRRYLNELESKGVVIKTHGGVLAVDVDLDYEIPYSSKKDLNINAKKRIGKVASKLIEEDDVIIIDAGSTTFEIAHHIINKKVTVITNDIKIACELASKPNIKLLITGGSVQKDVYTIIGPETESFLSKIHVHKVFLGADAINLEHGITNSTLEEAAIKKAMIKASEKVIVVADYSKINKRVFSDVCNISQVDTIVIDKIDDNYRKAFEQNGVNILIV